MIKYAQVGYRTPEAIKGWHETNMLNLSAEIGRKLSWSDYALACAGWVFITDTADIPIKAAIYDLLMSDGTIKQGSLNPHIAGLIAFRSIDKYEGKDASQESGTLEVTT